MKKIVTGILVLLVVVAISTKLSAQNDEKVKYILYEVEVTPEQLDNSIDAIQAENEFYKKHDYPFSSVTQYSNDGYLWYSIPIENYAELDKISAHGKKLWEENKEEMEKIQKGFEDAYTNVSRMLIEYQPDLSIPSEASETKPQGSEFRFFQKFYIKPGKSDEFHELTKKYTELRKKHNIESAFYTFFPVFGPNLDVVYFIDETGSNPAEHYQQNEQQWQKFGEEGQQLWEDVKPLVRKIETHLGQINYDLMYVPSGN